MIRYFALSGKILNSTRLLICGRSSGPGRCWTCGVGPVLLIGVCAIGLGVLLFAEAVRSVACRSFVGDFDLLSS